MMSQTAISDMAVWDIIYEHCSYFTPYSLAHLFTASGFQVTDVRETYDGQFIALEAVPVEPGAADMPLRRAELEQIEDLVTQFAARYRHKTAEEDRLLAALDEAGKDVVIWGAGSKGITFLNVLASGHRIRYAVDINPHKYGKYITGTGQQIVEPSRLRSIAPDTIIVMNAVYLDEIKEMVNALELTPEFITV